MLTVGIDLALRKTGFVVLEDGELLTHCVLKSTAEDVFSCVEQNVNMLQECLKFVPMGSKVAIESLSLGSVSSSTRTLAINYGAVFFNVLYNVYDVWEIAPTSLKKFATGNGRADKSAMVEALPNSVRDEFNGQYKKTTGLFDVTDAYFLAKFRGA